MGVSEIVSQLKELGLSDSKDKDSSGMDSMYTSGMHSYGDDQSSDTTVNNVEDPDDPDDPHRHEPFQYKEKDAVAAAEGQREKLTSATGRSFTKDRMYVG